MLELLTYILKTFCSREDLELLLKIREAEEAALLEAEAAAMEMEELFAMGGSAEAG